MKMSVGKSSLSAFVIEMADGPRIDGSAPGRLVLRATEDGWSLIGSGGEVVFEALGIGGRRECLEFARDHGVISVLS